MTPAENSRQYKRDLRRLMIVVTAAIAGFGALLIAVIAYAGWSSNASSLEREQQLVANALNQAISRTLNEQKSVAWWDDAVINISDRRLDVDFADSNFGYFLTDTYLHDEVYILNGAFQPAYAFFDAERQNPRAFHVRADDLAAVLSEVRKDGEARLQSRPGVFTQGDYRFLAGGGEGARWAGHIIQVDGRPAIVAAMTIVPNVDLALTPARPHVLVSVTFVDTDFLGSVGQSLLLPDLALAPVTERGRVGQAFIGDDGARLGQLTWTPKLPGDVLLKIILPLVIAGIALAGAISYWMLRRLQRASADLADREEVTRYQAKHDALSGLPNRAYFLEELDRTLTDAGVDGKPPRVAVAYLDIDRFKDLNDTMGHDAGDLLIKSVAERLRAKLPEKYMIARFGGDEFAILYRVSGRREANALAGEVSDALAEPFAERGGQIRVTASVGIALSTKADTSESVMRHADIALYEAKARGRDCAVVFTSSMADALETRRMIELDLRAALESDSLEMHYQAIVSAHTGEVTGLEALLRWHHPLCGEMEPEAIIPIAEESGLMPVLGDWTLRRVFSDAGRWPNLEITINLSPVQFRQPSLIPLLGQLAEQHKVDAHRIVIEISEEALLDSSERTRETLEALQQLGFKTSLDDFGSGYSSLAHLCNFKFDKIKIDRSFVVGSVKREAARAIVQAVVTLGRGLGMDIIAEGVETEMDAVTMRQFGCRELQGFYFSRPANPDGLDAQLAARAQSASAPPASWLLAARG